MIHRILIVNKYHFISGGAERYFFSVMASLKRQGVEPVPLSMDYEPTLETPYRKYFVQPVTRENHKIRRQHIGWHAKARLAYQAVYNHRSISAMRRIQKELSPDAAYLLNFNNHISPSIIDACFDLKVPVFMRMSDFNLVCASNMYYREGGPCMDCKGGLRHAVRYRCVHDSMLRSAAAVFSIAFHRWKRTYNKVHGFVTPTRFMKNELLELGIPERKIHYIPTFVRLFGKGTPDQKSPYILFVGRFEKYKGVYTALNAFAGMERGRNVLLRMLGDEGDENAAKLKEKARRLGCRNVVFQPFERNKEKLLDWIRRSLFVLIPSEFYENLPNTLLEAFSCGRPVVATRFGSLTENVHHGKTGLLYRFRDAEDLSRKMQWMIEHPVERERMGLEAFETARTEYSEERHVRRLLQVFADSLPDRR